jgi:hypothetical protein
VGLETGRRADRSDWLNLQITAQWVLLAAFLTFVIELLMPAWFPTRSPSRSEGKLSGLFTEPSHVAFSLFPCIAVLLLAEDKGTRQKGMLALFGLVVFSRSATLLALIMAWIMYRLLVQRKLRQTAFFALGIASLIVLGAAINYDRFVLPTMQRIVGVMGADETANLSSLVYVQGWQDAWSNLLRTRGMGLGLNMMGCGSLPDVPAREALTLFGLGELNAVDGSFPFAKVVSEAGVSGIVLYIALIWWWVRLEQDLRECSGNAARSAVVVQAALIFSFIASSFIRGAGYFSGALLLCVAAASGASRWRRNLVASP